MSLGVIVFGHGSRASVAEANQVIFEVAEMVKKQLGGVPVETAILNKEAGRAGIGDAVDRLVKQGATKIIIAPLFLVNGVHIQTDIPQEIDLLKKQHPGIEIKMAGHIGADMRIADILVERIQEANV